LKKKIIQQGKPEGEGCYYSGPQLTALRHISPIFVRANQPEGCEIKRAQGAMGDRVKILFQLFNSTMSQDHLNTLC
jgi:hypothetical protein